MVVFLEWGGGLCQLTDYNLFRGSQYLIWQISLCMETEWMWGRDSKMVTWYVPLSMWTGRAWGREWWWGFFSRMDSTSIREGFACLNTSTTLLKWQRSSSPWCHENMLHCKKGLATFLSPAGMSLTKLSLCGNNLITVYPTRESLVSDIPAGDRNVANFFWRCTCKLSPLTSIFILIFTEPSIATFVQYFRKIVSYVKGIWSFWNVA